MTLITRKFKRFMKKKLRSGKRNEGKGEFSKESTIICYKCKNPGHIKVECPLLKKKEKKEKWKRPMVAMTWSDNEESDSEDEAEPKEVANLCLMRIKMRYQILTYLKLFSMNYKIFLIN